MSDTQMPSTQRIDFDLAKGFANEKLTGASATPPVSNRVESSPAAATQATNSASASDARGPQKSRPLGDLHLKFKIDSETNQVTVYVLDRATREVVRTIPPDELQNLQAGDLLELFV